MKRVVLVVILLFGVVGLAVAQVGVKKKRPLPPDFGRVVINNYSEKAGLAPVVFDHWLHRANFTCRLCHVDITFGMRPGSTGIKAVDNGKGYYCGTCHNGKMKFRDKTVFAACNERLSTDNAKRCERCHSLGKNVKREYEFAAFTEKFPKERFGNGIDWERAENEKIITPIDYIEGVSIKKEALKVPKDITLVSKSGKLPDTIFSHDKHAVWAGCELCHPEIFIGVKTGATKYTMVEIFEGKFCGVCHNNVAFPLLDCQRCHTKPVS